MPKTETQILLEICDWLHANKFCFWRSNNVPAGGRVTGTYRSLPKYTPKGLPDIMVVHDGKFIGFEVKRAGDANVREANGRALRAGMLTPEQAEFGTKLALAGGNYYCVRSLDEATQAMGELFALPKGFISIAKME